MYHVHFLIFLLQESRITDRIFITCKHSIIFKSETMILVLMEIIEVDSLFDYGIVGTIMFFFLHFYRR